MTKCAVRGRLTSDNQAVATGKDVGQATVAANGHVRISKLLGRQWLGIDVEEKHAHMAQRRTDSVMRALTAHDQQAETISREKPAWRVRETPIEKEVCTC